MAFLEVKHLRMLRMIAKTENLTRAAEKLCVSQSALSQQLKDIEGKLEVALFKRTGRRMLLSRVGRRLLGRADRILDELDSAESEIFQEVNGHAGEIKIGARCMFCYQLLTATIKRFRQRYPKINLLIGNCPNPEEDLINGVFDLVISAMPVEDNRFAADKLFSDQLLCVMSSDHPLAGKRCLELDDFRGLDVISLVEKSQNPLYQNSLRPAGIESGRYMTVSYPEAIVEFIKAGLGVSLLPRWFMLPYGDCEELYMCPFTSTGLVLTWQAVYLEKENPPVYLREMVDLMADFHPNRGTAADAAS